MARSRRRRTPAIRRSRRRADWVYRPNLQILGVGTTTNDSTGTYEPNITTINSGVVNAQGKILYDSADFLAKLANVSGVGSVIGGQRVMPGQARAEGRKPCIRAVEGIVYLEPTSWALGNIIAAGFRLGVFEQALEGVVSLDNQYSMWANENAYPHSRVGHWANNSRNNCWERRNHYGFTSGQEAFLVQRIRWRGRKYLQGNECFALFVELESTSVNVRSQFWLRTLVEDEG